MFRRSWLIYKNAASGWFTSYKNTTKQFRWQVDPDKNEWSAGKFQVEPWKKTDQLIDGDRSQLTVAKI